MNPAYENVPRTKLKKAADAFIASWLESIDMILPKSDNIEMYREYFKKKSLEEILSYIDLIREKKFQLPFIIPNLKGEEIEIKRLLAVGEKFQHTFFQNITITDQQDTGLTYESPVKAMVVTDYVRRQIQTSENKLSVPKNANAIDDSTGQVTGDSKGGAFSLAETRNLEAKNLDNCIYEFLAPLGGNNEAYQIMEDMIIEQGSVTIEDIKTDERPGVVDMVDVLFRSAHIDGNW